MWVLKKAIFYKMVVKTCNFEAVLIKLIYGFLKSLEADQSSGSSNEPKHLNVENINKLSAAIRLVFIVKGNPSFKKFAIH